MKKLYKVVVSVWLRGVQLEAGSTVELYDREAKYLNSALEPVVLDAEAPHDEAVDPA